MDLPSEILIYIQTVKNYLDSNVDARNYFLSNNDENSFYDSLTNIAKLNFEKKGTPELSKLQFELLRISLNIFNMVEKEIETEDLIYEYIPNNIKFYLK